MDENSTSQNVPQRTEDVQQNVISPEPILVSDAPQPKPQKHLPKLLIPLVVTLALLGGGAYAYLGVYMQQPNVVWKDSLSNTSAALKSFNNFDQLATMQGSEFKGSLNVEKPTAATATFEGKAKDNNSTTKGSVSVSGAKVDFDIRTIAVENNDYPDAYFKVTGLNSVAGALGGEQAEMLNEFENKWFFADHTLFAQAAQSATTSDSLPPSIEFTEDDIRNIRTSYSEVLENYVFTSDESKSIMKRSGEPTQEDFDGKSSVKYPVELQKENTKAFLTSLKDATKETKLEELLAPGDKSLEEVLNFDEMIKSLEEEDLSKIKLEVWVDKGRKFIRNVRITPPADDSGSGHIDIGINYDGGDEYPFYIRFDGKDDQNNQMQGAVNLTSNRANKEVRLNMNITTGGTSAVSAKFDVTIKPSDAVVNVEKPEGATNIAEMFQGYQQALGAGTENFTDVEEIQPFDDFEL
ncbi:MAG: hypothetical protein M3Q79_03115 [bacterium]|nr:hypothetical protein [bacterium]